MSKWIYREINHDSEIDIGFFDLEITAQWEAERAIKENKVVSGPFQVSDDYVLNERNSSLSRARAIWGHGLKKGTKVKIVGSPGGDLFGTLQGADGAEGLKVRIDGEKKTRIFLAGNVEVV